MPTHTEEFLYTLRIRNQTGRELAYLDGELRRGIWCRDGVDGQGPIAVPAGAEIEVLGIRARTTGKPDGYEFRCIWGAPPDAGADQGAVTVNVNVPYLPGRNRAGLDVSGVYRVEGWTGISILGRRFSHSLTVKRISGV